MLESCTESVTCCTARVHVFVDNLFFHNVVRSCNVADPGREQNTEYNQQTE